MMMPSEMSDVDVLFSQVHVLLCEIDVKLSKCQEVSQSGKSVLPRVGNILAQMQDIVSHHFIETSHTANLWWDDASHEVWYHEEDEDEEGFSEEDFNITEVVGNVEDVDNAKEEEVVAVVKEDVDDNKRDTGGEDEEETLSIAHRVKARKCAIKADVVNTTALALPPLTPPRKVKRKYDPFLAAITRAIGKLAPKAVYNKLLGEKLGKERDAKRVANIVPNVFRSLWESVNSEEVLVTVPDPYPTLDWSKVNKRFIQNIPPPTLLPVHSCSPDPEFYEWSERKGNGGTIEKVPSNFERRSYYLKKGWANAAGGHVFGGLYGYETSEGIISVSNTQTVHHGYIWNNGSWILHAQLPKDKGKKYEFEKKGRRKKVPHLP